MPGDKTPSAPHGSAEVHGHVAVLSAQAGAGWGWAPAAMQGLCPCGKSRAAQAEGMGHGAAGSGILHLHCGPHDTVLVPGLRLLLQPHCRGREQPGIPGDQDPAQHILQLWE